jgi:hypothetical protein
MNPNKPTDETMEEGDYSGVQQQEAVEDTTPESKDETFQAIDSFVESLSPDELNYLRECLAEKDVEDEGEKEEVVMDIKDFDDK